MTGRCAVCDTRFELRSLAQNVCSDCSIHPGENKVTVLNATIVPPKTEPRFFLAQNNDCHWYLVPCDRRKEWDAWRSIDEDDERAWTAPDYAKLIGGSPSLITFTNPEIQ
jgi:hypothetical protein